jgi:hypothetical protein
VRVRRIARRALLVSLLIPASSASAQEFASRGFADARLFLYPQRAPNDPVRAVAEGLVRYEPSLKAASWLRAFASFDARMDTHGQVERRWTIDWQDRGILRPPLSVRRLSAIVSHGGLNVEVGKQFIRWGKADVLNPTDRFAPRDFLSVVDNEFLGVTAARLTWEARGNTLDVVWVPRFTPSRIPLFDQRWTVLPNVGVPLAPGVGAPGTGVPAQESVPVTIVDAGAQYPNGSQAGVRFNRSGPGYEFSASFYNGFNHLPLINASIPPLPAPALELLRTYPQMRMYGADAAIPNRWVTFKGEIGYFTSTTPQAEDYGIYVVQLERQAGEWLFVGGYAGDFVTRQARARAATPAGGIAVPFAADRGLAEAFLGRASLAIDSNRNLVLQGAVRQNGHGTWLKAEYSQAFGQHLRATFDGNLIRGREDDFIGQFRENSNVTLDLRYSF